MEVRFTPDSHAAHSLLAQVLLLREEWEGAVDSLLAALKVRPDDHKARKRLVQLYVKLKRPNDAALHVGEIPKGDDDRASLAYNIALVFYGKKQDAKAARLLKVALGSDSKHPRTWYLLGLVRLRQGNLPSAKENLERYLEIEPSGSEADEARKALADIESQ